MANPVKNFVWSFVHEVKRLCTIITKHQGVFMALIATVVTDPAELATVQAMLTAVVAGCAVLDRHYPNV